MARKPMVTRTVKITHVLAQVADLENNTIVAVYFDVPRVWHREDKLLAFMKAKRDTEYYKILNIVDTQVFTKKIGMTEEEFLSHAYEVE